MFSERYGMQRIVGLGGGIGASRLWRALVTHLDPSELTLVVNTGDDIWIHGVRVCPDIDTTLYALSGRQNLKSGWGIQGDTFRCMEELRELSGGAWFNLGDLDLATHLLRTAMLREGVGLARITSVLANKLGVTVKVLPASDDEIATIIEDTAGGRLHYEEFLIRHQARYPVRRVYYSGIVDARPASGVIEAIRSADRIIIAPSNPVASIGPVIAIEGVREALCERRSSVIAVSPIVKGVKIDDPGEALRALSRSALLTALGVTPSASGVAEMYSDFCSGFVIDKADVDETKRVRRAGVRPYVAETLLHRGADADSLVELLLTTSRVFESSQPVESH